MSILESYGWPGNIRELRAAVEHAVVLGVGGELTPADLPASLRLSEPDHREAAGLNLAEVEAAMIRKALSECGENRTKAAKKLGISRRTLHRHLTHMGITKPPA
jgi:two-component system response regulator HydG